MYPSSFFCPTFGGHYTPSSQKIDDNTPTGSRTLPGDYKLIWSDEFKGTSLDQTKWTKYRSATTTVGPAPGMLSQGMAGEKHTPIGHAYTENNVTVVPGADNNGYLRLTARKQSTPIQNLGTDDFPYEITRTSGAVHNRYTGAFRYGKVVVKVKNVPNFPFMHHGIWTYAAENGAPGLEVDFPDAPNSPLPEDGNNELTPEFGYTYLNNRHPRMAMSVVGVKTDNTSFGEQACAGQPDPDEQLELDKIDKEREYWMEWDRDEKGAYVKVGVNAKDKNGVYQEQTVRWWGLQNETDKSGGQFIPDAIRNLPIDSPLRPTYLQCKKSQTLGRYDKAQQHQAPFSNYQTWFWDNFPMFVVLDLDASSGWAGGACLVDPKGPDRQYRRVECDTEEGYIKQNERALSVAGGQSMDIDYVRVYQRDISAKNFKPIILDGAHFARESVVRLYRTADVNAPYRTPETRWVNETTVVALLNDQDDVFLRQGATGDVDGFVCVDNRGVGPFGVSAFRRIILGGDENATIRANGFSHRYKPAEINTSTTPSEPPLIIKEGNAPNNPFTWTGIIDKLSMDLSNLPALGGTPVIGKTTPPDAYSSLTRMQEARGKWELRFRSTDDATGTTTWSPVQTFLQTATPQPTSSWRVEQPSQYRAGEGFRAVRVADDGDNNHIVRELGFYPSCSDLIEVTTFVATPAVGRTNVGGIYDDQNLCGPFRIRTFLDPRPQVKITERTQTPPVNEISSLSIGVQLETSPMMGTTSGIGSSFVWQRRILKKVNNHTTANVPWVNISTGILADNAHLSGSFTENNLQVGDSIQVRCLMTFPDVSINSIAQAACRTMSSPITPVLSVQEQTTLVLVNNAGAQNFESSTIQRTSLLSETLHQDFSTGISEQILQPQAKSKQRVPVKTSHTINLLTLPNPADAQVNVRFTLPSDAHVTVEVRDVLQRPALTTPLTETLIQAGEHDIALSVGVLPSGTYSVRIIAKVTNGAIIQEQRTMIIHR